MRFCQVFILTDEERDLIPKISVVVILDAIANALSFAYVDRGLSSFWIRARKEIDSRFLRFLPPEHAFELGTRSRDCLASPVRQLGFAEALRVSVNFGSPLTRKSLMVAVGI